MFRTAHSSYRNRSDCLSSPQALRAVSASGRWACIPRVFAASGDVIGLPCGPGLPIARMPTTRRCMSGAYTSRQMLSDSVVPLYLLSGCVCHRIRNQTERLQQYLWFRYAYIHFRFIVPACGSHTVYLCDTRMLRNVDRKSSYPHCGDNRVDNVCDYPHIGDNSVDSLGTIRRPHQIDLHQSRQSAMRNNPSGTHDHTACPAAGHLQMPITIMFPVWRQQLSELLTLASENPKTTGYLRCD